MQTHRHTIQVEIERALKTFFRKSVRIHFTSRTDAGVHALDQWVMIKKGYSIFDSLSPVEKKRCLHSLNALLPDDIRLFQILKLSPKFHPKTSVQWKEYEYTFALGPVLDPLWINRVWWIRADLDIDKMRDRLKSFEGEHDFSAYATRVKNIKGSTVRKIYSAELTVKRSRFIPSLRFVTVRIRGSGFLHHMVRNMVGSLVELGRGRSSLKPPLLAPAGALVLRRTKVNSKYFKIVRV